jgi:GNAT superfamily N-acetyltransferase
MTLERANTLKNLPEGLTARPVTLDDLPKYMVLVHACDVEEHGRPITSENDIRTEWTLDEFDLNHSTRAVFTPDGQIVAYGEVWDTHKTPVQPYFWARVHPEWREKGLGTALFTWAEDRAHEVFERVPADAKVTLRCGARANDEAANLHLQNMGMISSRESREMLIVMDAAPPAPQWPDGITVTTQAQLNDLRAVYQAIEDSFQDHRGYVPEDVDEAFRRFEHFINNDELIDFSQWWLAMDGDRIAGISLCRPESWEDPTSAYVMELGVLREYRKRGLGLALLHHSFGEYWRMGQPRVTLHVDGSSLTGATRLYERAGMHINRAYNQYDKVLRDGKEYSNQG